MLVDNKTWNAPSSKDKRIQALAATMEKMEKKVDAASKQAINKSDTKTKGFSDNRKEDKPK